MSTSKLIDLINQNQRVLRLHFLERLNDFTRHRADIGTPVSLDFGNIGKATDRETVKVPLESTSDGLADRGFANTGRSSETNDLAFDGAPELTDSDKLQDTVLDFLESVVVLVQNSDGVLDVKVFGSITAPRDLGDPVEVVTGDVELGSRTLEGRKLLDFLVKHLLNSLGEVELCSAFLELFDELVLAVIVDAEFLLDTLELFHEEVFLLLASDLLVDLLGNLLLQLGVGELLLDHVKRLVETLLDHEGFQDGLQLGRLGTANSSRKVGKTRRLRQERSSGLDRKRDDLVAEQRVELRNLLHHIEHLVCDGLDERVVSIVWLVSEVLDVDDGSGKLGEGQVDRDVVGKRIGEHFVVGCEKSRSKVRLALYFHDATQNRLKTHQA